MGRTVFVISDLHVGGALPSKGRPRGFQICTQIQALAQFVAALPSMAEHADIELVINGDFVDFLAEETEAGGFVPFINREERAATVFRAIVGKNQCFFDALRAHLEADRKLTILGGNHDVELAYPAVRAALEAVLGKPTQGLKLVLDGTPYRLDNAVIEHGHQYDGWNAIKPESVTALIDQSDTKHVPPGSELVAKVMNPLKKKFAFVDLVKPEIETVVPLLLVLNPSSRAAIGRVLLLFGKAHWAQTKIDSQGVIPAAANVGGATTPTPIEAVNSLLKELLQGESELFNAELITENDKPLPAAALAADEALATLELLLGSPRRMKALLRALRVLRRDLSFARDIEHDERYVAGAVSYESPIEYVVMGHTHLAKRFEVFPGRMYFNSGTWADLIPFPDLGTDDAKGMEYCKAFVQALQEAQTDPTKLKPWIQFRPTYVRLQCEGNRVTSGQLMDYQSP